MLINKIKFNNPTSLTSFRMYIVRPKSFHLKIIFVEDYILLKNTNDNYFPWILFSFEEKYLQSDETLFFTITIHFNFQTKQQMLAGNMY